MIITSLTVVIGLALSVASYPLFLMMPYRKRPMTEQEETHLLSNAVDSFCRDPFFRWMVTWAAIWVTVAAILHGFLP